MENLSQVSLLAKSLNAPKANQNTIGKNGSFWLPPDSDLKLQSTSTKAFKSPYKSRDGEKPSSSKNQNFDKHHLRPNLATKVANRNPTQNPKVLNPKTADNRSPIKLGQAASNFSKAKTSAPVIGSLKAQNARSNDTIRLQHFASEIKNPKVGQHSKVSEQSSSVNPDSQNKKGKENPRDGGTKDASKKFDMISSEKVLDFSLPEKVAKESVNRSPMHRSSLELTKKAIGAKIKYISKLDKKIVRFALDLPNGGKFGVRLEKNGNELSLSLICLNENSKELVSSIGSRLFPDSEGLKVAIYESFKDMDLAREQVA